MPVRITNATAVYTIMLALFAAGMWAILAYGSTLRAPPDLAGELQLAPEGAPSAKPQRALIDQSGRFLRLRIVGGQTLDLRMPRHFETNDTDIGRTTIHLTGAGASVSLDDTPAPDVYEMLIDQSGRQQRYTATLVTRTYPRRATPRAQGNEASNPSAIPSLTPAIHLTSSHAP